MRPTRSLVRPATVRPVIAAALSGLVALAMCPHASAATGVATAEDEATAACEQSARRTLAARAGQSAEVSFKSAPTVLLSLSTDRQLVLSGEGSWRTADGVRTVKFTCNVDRRTFETVGVVVQDTAPLVAKAAPPRKPPAEPDMSHLSVASCESSAVQALQKRWPRVSQISFDPGTRSFSQDRADRAQFRGEGRALPAQGQPTTYFGFECDIDPQDGRVLRTHVSG
jgi:hypothetical protein